MSLLLDALKKAAQEKQNADSVVNKAEAGADARQGLEQERDVSSEKIPDRHEDSLVYDELELELDDEMLEQTHSLSDQDEALAAQDDIPSVNEQVLHQEYVDNRVTPTPSTVSDEALQLLIHKTNEEHKKTRLKLWGGIVIGSIVFLSISGMYYYADMMDEIESMRLKHQIALATLKSKTRIEDNLTSLAVASDNNNQPKTTNVYTASQSRSSKRPVKAANEISEKRYQTETFSVQRGDVKDPVSENLQRGWMSYQKKDYETSRQEYQKVLNKEPFNHDALLGMAAVSLQTDEVERARDIYIKLLERDPRDPHAHAGLANIAQTKGASLSETRLKQLIEFRPDDSHLQFALGNLYVQKKSWPEAQQAFFNAWKADNNNPDYAYNLAVSLDQLGKHKQARAYYEDSLKLAAGKNISFSPDAVKNRLAYLGALQ